MHLKKMVFSGSFDPMTLGHLDVIQGALEWCDELHVVVANHPSKISFLSLEGRVESIQKVFIAESRVVVSSWNGLLVDYMAKHSIDKMVRGLRNVQDYEYESQLLGMHQLLSPTVQMVWLPSKEEYKFLSSSFVREAFKYGRNLEKWLPKEINQLILQEKKLL